MSRSLATNHTTSYSYADTFVGGSGTPPGLTNAYLTTVTNPLGQQTRYSWNYGNGELASRADQNDINIGRPGTTYAYNDPLARLRQINYPDGGQTSYSYNDISPVSVTTTTAITSSTNKSSITIEDGLGHPIQTQLTSDWDGPDFVDITYDAFGRKSTVSNPHRISSSTTDGTTTYSYDSLGRTTNVSQPDGSTVTTSYSGNQTTVTDEAGNQRTSQTDAFGRLTDVWEAPNVAGYNYGSHYQYDALDNLICAVQKGTDTTAFSSCASASATWHPRSFVYDSLSRLTQANNPESGTIIYGYDANGNLVTKVAPSPNQGSTATVTTNYTYDALNRLTGKSYTDTFTSNPATAPVVYGYDGVTTSGCPGDNPPGDADSNPIGRRTSMCDGSGAANWTHDPVGRINEEKRDIASVIGLADTDFYNYDGSVKSRTSLGFGVSYTYNGAGRPISATGAGVNFIQANSATYAPFGGLTGASMGPTPIVITNAYNNRLQPLLLSAAGASPIMSLCYDFYLVQVPQNNTTPCSPAAGTGDNGNVRVITNNLDSTRTRGFAYDPLNRVTSAGTIAITPTPPQCWGYLYNYDAWGNLLAQAPWTKYYGACVEDPGMAVSADTNNHILGKTYDAAGNVINDGNGNTYTYDAENRLIATSGMSYVYDGDGKRVEKCTEGSIPGTCGIGATGTLYWRAWGADPLAETDLAGNILENYIFFNGQRIARIDQSTGPVHFYFSDHLGSHGVVADITGSTCEQDIDYYPFGGVHNDYCGTVAQKYKFTGKERDSESGLDMFGARYYANTTGRFMTPDWSAEVEPVPYAKLGNPQTMNLYAYVGNNPLSRFDPDGHCADHYKDGSCKVNVDPKTGDAGAKAGKQLEGVLNKYDKAVNALNDKGKFNIKDSKGKVIGSMTGKEIKAVWNGTSFTVTSQTDFHNGGAGGGTGGTWNGDSFSGQSNLSPGAVSAYANAASARDEAPRVGLSTLTFHELGHETHFGDALTQHYPVTPTISWPRERGASSAGSRMAGSVDAPFDCSIPGGCQ